MLIGSNQHRRWQSTGRRVCRPTKRQNHDEATLRWSRQSGVHTDTALAREWYPAHMHTHIHIQTAIASILSSLCSAAYLGWQRGTAHICCCTPCCGEAPLDVRQSVNISWLPGPQQQTCYSGTRRVNGTDGRTDARQLHRPCYTLFRNCCSRCGFQPYYWVIVRFVE